MAGIADIKKNCGGARAGVTEESIQLIFEMIAQMVRNGESVMIKNFGTFKKVHTEERQGVNPQEPSKKITIAAKDHLKFKASPSVDMSAPKAADRRR